MRIAYLTGHFGSNHAVAAVYVFFNIVGVQWCKVAGPAAAGIELGVGCEQSGSAANATVNAGLVVILILPGESTLGAFLAGNFEAGGREFFAPLGLCFNNFFNHDLVSVIHDEQLSTNDFAQSGGCAVYSFGSCAAL